MRINKGYRDRYRDGYKDEYRDGYRDYYKIAVAVLYGTHYCQRGAVFRA